MSEAFDELSARARVAQYRTRDPRERPLEDVASMELSGNRTATGVA